MFCHYCNFEAELKTSDEAFSFEMQIALRIDTPRVWICQHCLAWAGARCDGKALEAFGDVDSHEWRHEAFVVIQERQQAFSTSFSRAAAHFQKALGLDETEVPWLTDEQCRRIVEHACSIRLQAFGLTP